MRSLAEEPAELWSRPVHQVPIAVLDLEMTGLSPEFDRVCEVAVVRGSGHQVVREYQTLVRPEVPMSDNARRCHGISDRMLTGAPLFVEVAGDVVTALRGAVVVCHNADVDLGFLHRELDGSPLVFAPPVTLDTLLMARRLFAFRRNDLQALCSELDIPRISAHRALSDARATFALFERMIDALDPHASMTVRDVADLVGAMAPNSPQWLRHQQLLRDAFRQKRTVEIGYQSTRHPLHGLTQRRVDIWALPWPHIYAYCHLRKSKCVFRLERVRTVRLTDQAYEAPSPVAERV